MNRKNNKGQVLIIMAIIVIIVLFLIKTEASFVSSYDFSESKNLNTFDNIRNELKNSGKISIWKDNYNEIYEFSNFVEGENDLNLFYCVSDFRDPNLNITITNFLGKPVWDVNISQNLTDESDVIDNLANEEYDYVDFSWSGSETNFEINVTYNCSDGLVSNTFYAKAGTLKYFTVFYDLKMSYGESYLKDKFSVSSVRA